MLFGRDPNASRGVRTWAEHLLLLLGPGQMPPGSLRTWYDYLLVMFRPRPNFPN